MTGGHVSSVKHALRIRNRLLHCRVVASEGDQRHEFVQKHVQRVRLAVEEGEEGLARLSLNHDDLVNAAIE